MTSVPVQSWGAITLLGAGMILLFIGFFMYIGGDPEILSVAVTLVGAVCEFFGFLMAYLGYKKSIEGRASN